MTPELVRHCLMCLAFTPWFCLSTWVLTTIRVIFVDYFFVLIWFSLILLWHVRFVSFAENHVLVGELMEAKANVGDHGGAYATQGNGNPTWLNDADINGATGGYSLGFALTVIQVFLPI
jgi:hypothetical protein